jgi:hypothetical protein
MHSFANGPAVIAGGRRYHDGPVEPVILAQGLDAQMAHAGPGSRNTTWPRSVCYFMDASSM